MVVAPPTPKLHTKEVGSILNGDDPLENTISLFLVQVRHTENPWYQARTDDDKRCSITRFPL